MQFVAIAYIRGALANRYFDIALIEVIAMLFLLSSKNITLLCFNKLHCKYLNDTIKILTILYIIGVSIFASHHKMIELKNDRTVMLATFQETVRLLNEIMNLIKH